MPPIRNAGDLCLRWRALMGPLGFGLPRPWIAFLSPDDTMSAQLTQIEEIPPRADAKICRPLLEMCRHIVGRSRSGGSVAFLLTRPGRNPMDDADRKLGPRSYLRSSAGWGFHVAGALRQRCRATGLRA